MGQSAAQRQARWRERQRAGGTIAVTVLIPTYAASDLKLIAEALRSDHRLEFGPLRDRVSGKLRSTRRPTTGSRS